MSSCCCYVGERSGVERRLASCRFSRLLAAFCPMSSNVTPLASLDTHLRSDDVKMRRFDAFVDDLTSRSADCDQSEFFQFLLTLTKQKKVRNIRIERYSVDAIRVIWKFGFNLFTVTGLMGFAADYAAGTGRCGALPRGKDL